MNTDFNFYLKLGKQLIAKLGRKTRPWEILLLLAIIFWYVFMARVAPELVGFLRNSGEELSAPVLTLISVSDFTIHYCVYFFPLLALWLIAKVVRP